MKLHADKPDRVAITGYGPGWIAVNGERHITSLLIGVDGALTAWDCRSFDALTAAHFASIADSNPELLIFGSGHQLRFASTAVLRALLERRIGVETMDTGAACRTFNILAGEGRRVAAALILEA
jgi:uncharacterized protein